MAENVLVSFDEEKLMNDILDQGIDELKKSNPHTKSNSFNNKPNISNVNYDPKNDLIMNKKLANLNYYSNGSSELYQKRSSDYANEFERVASNFSSENLSKIKQIKSYIKEGIDTKIKEESSYKFLNNNQKEKFNINNNNIENLNNNSNRNITAYVTNHKKNLAELKNNYSINNNNINNANSVIENPTNANFNEIKINQAHVSSNNNNDNNNYTYNIPNSSALGFKSPDAEGNVNLNDDTMQIMTNQTLKHNMLLNSNNSNSREERQIAKSSALRALLDEMKAKNALNVNYENQSSSENLISKNLTSRDENHNSDFALGNINTNYYGNYGNGISQTARTNNFLANNFFENNNNNDNNNQKIEHNLRNDFDYPAVNFGNDNSARIRNFSVDSANSNAAADLNFDDMKNEIDHLQSKIDGLEKKLLDNTSSKESFEINFNTQSALERIKLTSENLNNSKSSIKQQSKKNNHFKNAKSTKNQTDSILKINKSTLHKLSNSSYTKEEEREELEANDLNYRRKYNPKNKLNLKSKYALLFDSDCHNINTSQEFSPLADRSHYKSPSLAARKPNAQALNKTALSEKEVEEKRTTRNFSMRSENSRNSKINLSSSFSKNKNINNNNNNNNNNNKGNKLYADRLNYSRGVYEDSLSRRSKANVKNLNNQSFISDLHCKSLNEEADDERASKRVADIIAKTKSILGRSASREFRSKSKELKTNKSATDVKAEDYLDSKSRSGVFKVLKKSEKASAVDFTAEYSGNESSENAGRFNKNKNENNYYDFSDHESKIRPKGFEAISALRTHKSKEKPKGKSKSKSKSKAKSKKAAALKNNIHTCESNNNNAFENLQTFTQNNANLTSYHDTSSKASKRKMHGKSAAKDAYSSSSGIISYKNKRLATGSNNRSFSIKNMFAKNKSKIATNNNEQKDKEKIIKLKERNNELKLILKTERKKCEELDKKLKKIKFKEENFDCLEKNFIALQKEFEKMQKSYSQSELIRKEQAKLIKSMKYEIELLKEGR